MNDATSIFIAEGYKYIKQRDEFHPIKMKVAIFNERIRNLMIENVIATFLILFKSDLAEHYDSIVVNSYQNKICGVSSEVDKVTFFEYDFTTTSSISGFIELHMRVFKQIARGVKPYDSIYLELE